MLKFILFPLFLLIAVQVAGAQSRVCTYWKSNVDPRVTSGLDIDISKESNVLKGIDCLLGFQGDTGTGLFGGATSDSVSQIFPQPSVEICALYYASYLFFEKWNHASAVALVDSRGRYNSPIAVRKAYSAYRKWRAKISSLGLKKARELHIDPLRDSGVHWY